MTPSKSRRNESRRSSILKSRKPRQPLQNVNLDSSSNENSPSKIKRRVSFAEKKHVKEFCHSTEQGTVWDNTYEEHDFSLKGSFEQNAETELKKNALCSFNNDCCSEEAANCDLDFTNPVESTSLSNVTHSEHAKLPNKSYVSKDMISNAIVVYSDTSEEYIESDKEPEPESNISHSSKDIIRPSIIVYKDSDEEDNTDEEDNALQEQKQKQKNNDNLDMNCTNCSNMSMELVEAIPAQAKMVSDLNFEQMPTMLQNHETIKECAANIHNTTDANYINDSMVLTSVVRPNIIDVANIDNWTKKQTHKAKTFNDASMEIKPVSSASSSNVYITENLRMDEPICRDDRTMFHNTSMEMTKPIKNKQEIADTRTLSEKNIHDRKNVNISICTNEGTKILCKSMELTEAVSLSLHRENIFHNAQSVNKSTSEQYKNDKTQFFNNASMEITKSVNTLARNIDKENVKVNELVSKDDKTVLLDVPMEMTTAISSKRSNEITQSIYKASEDDVLHYRYEEKDANNSTCSDERTKLLCKSMELTEVAPISFHNERSLNTIQSTIQPLSKPTTSFNKNSEEITNRIDAVANITIQDTSMEITTAVPSTIVTQNVQANKTENLIISETNELRHLAIDSNVNESPKNTTQNFTIFDEMETKGTKYNELRNINHSPQNSLHQSLNTNLKNVNTKKRSKESEESQPKRFYGIPVEVQSREDDSFPVTSVNYTNDIECNESTVKDKLDDNKTSGINTNLDEINEYSFLEKNFPSAEKDSVALESTQPPSFVYFESEEENSFHKLQSSITTDVPIKDISNQLTINNATEPQYLEKKLTNEKQNYETEDSQKNTAIDKTKADQKNYCQITDNTKSDDKLNKSSFIARDTDKKSIKSTPAKDGKNLTVQELHIINQCTSLIVKEIEVTDENQADEKEDNREKINEDAKQNDSEEKHSDEIIEKSGNRSDCLENVEATIEDQVTSEECKENINAANNEINSEKSKENEIKQQDMERRDENTTRMLEITQHNEIENIENECLTEKNPFLALVEELETYALSDDCIWDVYYKNNVRKLIVFGFMADSLLIAMFLHDCNNVEEDLIKEIKIISRLADDAGAISKIVHKLIMEKIDAGVLAESHKTRQDILPMLNFISQEVKLAMDFMFDLDRLNRLNLMEIAYNEISFIINSKHLDIILKITIKVKQFDKLTANDISVCCLLGKIKEKDIKNLIKSVKKDHLFLRRYMNDVKDYVDIMEETSKYSND